MVLETDLAGQGMKGILSPLLEITFIQIVRRMKFKDEKIPDYAVQNCLQYRPRSL